MGHQRIRPFAPGVAEALLWDLVHVARCFDLHRVRGSLTASLEAALHAVADPAAPSENGGAKIDHRSAVSVA